MFFFSRLKSLQFFPNEILPEAFTEMTHWQWLQILTTMIQTENIQYTTVEMTSTESLGTFITSLSIFYFFDWLSIKSLASFILAAM